MVNYGSGFRRPINYGSGSKNMLSNWYPVLNHKKLIRIRFCNNRITDKDPDPRDQLTMDLPNPNPQHCLIPTFLQGFLINWRKKSYFHILVLNRFLWYEYSSSSKRAHYLLCKTNTTYGTGSVQHRGTKIESETFPFPSRFSKIRLVTVVTKFIPVSIYLSCRTS